MIAELEGVATVFAVALAATFALSAVAKLLAPATTAAEFEQLGVPMARRAARIVPVAELALVPTLVITPRIGAAAALLVLVAFTAVVVRAVRSGRTVGCGCFGSLSREPVSIAMVARNLVLVSMAGLALIARSPVVPDLASLVLSSAYALSAIVAVQLLSMQRSLGRLWSVDLAGESAPSRRSVSDLTPPRGGKR